MFILHHHSQRCTGCSRTESWSHLYTADDASPTRLKPCGLTPYPDAPIIVVRIPERPMPICFACVPADSLSRGEAARIRFEEARRRKAAEAAYGSPSVAAPAKRPATLDELA